MSTLKQFPQVPQTHKITLPPSTILHSSMAGGGLGPPYATGACSGTWLSCEDTDSEFSSLLSLRNPMASSYTERRGQRSMAT